MKKQLTWEEWVEKYIPIKNHLNSDSSLDGYMFETFGKEHEYVRQQKLDKIWTLIDEDGVEFIITGYHFVNRLGYFITTLSSDERDIIISH